jgi:ribosome-associated translation inhibitor RaiA
LSYRTRTHGSYRQRGKVFPADQTAFGAARNEQLATEVHAESVEDSRDSVDQLERDFRSAGPAKKEEIRKATQLEANRLDIEAHNGRNSVEARESLMKRSRVFDSTAKRMDRDLRKRKDPGYDHPQSTSPEGGRAS